MGYKINWDALGAFASVACAIHCAVLPLLITSFSIFSIEIVENKFFEFGMILLTLIVGLYSLIDGRAKHHRGQPLWLFCVGIVFLFSKEVWHQYHILFLTPAVLCIVVGHYLNFKFIKIHCKQTKH